jgi:uncharacterized protein YndB with AHSA1/START domain
VPTTQLEFSRDYDLPAAIVWDALIDDVLVEGWLATARIEPQLGGMYWLDWQSGTSLAASNGVITDFAPPEAHDPGRLTIETDNIGTLEFVLTSIPGGTRGSATLVELRILVNTEPRLLASTYAYWNSNFDQLEDLLRGHPVDWSRWQLDRGEAWARYLRDASGGN